MSLYRKYRPQTFADVVGQEHVVTTLEHAVAQGKLAHAYLFAGSRGTGKTSVARILARHILTEGIEDATLRRQVEEGVREGSIVDLIEIDGASNRRIEDSRDLVEKIQFSPVVAKAKVYIIDEVHMLTKEAFNALLKTLEEPPPYAFFILATTELQKIPSTIQSRCQRFAFHQIREEDIIRRLQYIADREKITIDRAALRAIARHAQGGLRDAIALLDQLQSLETIVVEDVEERLGRSGEEHVEALLAALDDGNRDAVLRIVQELEDAGTALENFLRQLLAAVRVRLHTAVAAGEPTDRLTALLDILLRAARDIRLAPVPGLVLEAAFLKLCGTGDSLPPSAPPIKKESRLFRRAKEETPEQRKSEEFAKRETPVEAVESRPAVAERGKEAALSRETIIEAPELTLASVLAIWPGIVAKASPAALKMSLKNGRVTEVTERAVTVGFASNFHRERVAQKDALHTLEQLLLDHFKRPLRLHCILAEEKDVQPIADEAMVDLAQAVNEIF